MNFKVGDWVTNTEGFIFQYKEEFKEANDFTLWEPKEGDWCWVSDFDYNGHIPKLRQFCRMENKNAIFLEENGRELIYKFIQPFIGELPSFLKDNQ